MRRSLDKALSRLISADHYAEDQGVISFFDVFDNVILTVLVEDLFDEDGNRFEFDLD